MRNCIIYLPLAVVVSLVCGLAPASASERKAFRYGNGVTGGVLIHDYANRWVEFVGSAETYGFEETGRSNDTVEFLDRSRDVGLRVHAENGEIRLPGSTAWQPWERGRWIGMDEIPPSIRFLPTDQKIRLAYFVPKDRLPIARYEQRIRVVMQVVADVFSDLQANGVRSRGFTFVSNSQGEPVVHLIRGNKPAQYYNDAPAYDESKHFVRICEEIPDDLGSLRRHMIMLFPETYEPGPAPVEWRGSVGRGSHISTDGGVAMISAWILRDEFCATRYAEQKELILDATPILGRTAFGTRRINSPRFEFIEDGFGAAAHELGHALGLPHDARQPNDVMGQGFRSLQVNYLPSSAKRARLTFSKENARLLGVSRYFARETDRTDNAPPTAEIRFQVSSGRPPTIRVSMHARDNRALRAAVFYDPQNDTVIGGVELKGKEQVVDLALPLETNVPGGRNLLTMLSSARKTGARLGSAGSDVGINLVTLLADAGGNIEAIITPVRAP